MNIRIGLVGAGWMGKAHINAFQNALMLIGSKFGKPLFEVISDTDINKAESGCEKLGFSRWTEKWEDVVSDENVDLVDIATPNAFHYEVAKAALENGKHVYCEKPLTISPEQSRELMEIAKVKGVVNYVGFNNVSNPANLYIKELIDNGKLGNIVRFTGTYDQDALLDNNLPITWRHINKVAGSGALGDLGSHVLSVAQYFFGDVKSVNAISNTVIKKRPKSLNSSELVTVENDDVITALIEYKNGTIGTIGSSRIATGRKNHLAYEIQGTKGSVYYTLERINEVNVYFVSDNNADRGFRKVFLGTDHKGYSVFSPQSGIGIGFNDIKILEVHRVLSAISNKEPYICDFEFGWKIDSAIDAILKSASSNQWVNIDFEEVLHES